MYSDLSLDYFDAEIVCKHSGLHKIIAQNIDGWRIIILQLQYETHLIIRSKSGEVSKGKDKNAAFYRHLLVIGSDLCVPDIINLSAFVAVVTT